MRRAAKKKTAGFKDAPEVEKVADELISQYHSHLINADIRYVFNEKTPVTKKKEVWGRARLFSGLNAYIAFGGNEDQYHHQDDGEPVSFFVIELAFPVWLILDKKQREALVDHELSHCWVDEEGKLSLAPHDVEEFSAVVRRHGLWRDDVKRFIESAKQLPLFDRKHGARSKAPTRIPEKPAAAKE